jgi:dihydroorotate dehydrogenase
MLIKKIDYNKAIFLKISPNLDKSNLDKIIKLSLKYKISGLIISNLNKNKSNITDIKFGGLSGKPVEELSNQMISYVYKKTKGKLIIVGCGGVFSAEDAYKKIKAGATLIQLITGMIYEGPQLINKINRDLVKLLEKDGFNNISEAIGKSKI